MYYDLSLYGHLTVDHIFHDFDQSVTLGAMANVWNALIRTDSGVSVKLNPTAIGTAMVLVYLILPLLLEKSLRPI